ncbi:MAG: hypothetical protein ACLRWM_11035 [Streptococcus sp.]
MSEVNTIADGATVQQIGSKTFKYIKEYVDDIVLVNDYELMEAFLLVKNISW